MFFVKFGVADLDEVRTLVEGWGNVVETILTQTPAKKRDDLTPAYDTAWVIVNKEQEAGQDVFLEILAPLHMIDQFFKDLRQKGLRFTQEFDTERCAIRCRFIPPDSQP